MENIKVLAINPGSTSTKIAVYENNQSTYLKTLRHEAEELEQFGTVFEQFKFRKKLIVKNLKKAGLDFETLHAVIGRGGLIKPVQGGIYEVNDALKNDLEKGVMGEHASNLGGLIALEITSSIAPNAKAYIADPVVVDEMEDVARISGHPDFKRLSIFHALNHKAIARQYAKRRGIAYKDVNLIIAHLGGGISVGAHRKGKVVDVNNGLDGEGPFSPERSGTLPTGQLIDMCFSGEYTKADMKKILVGGGGLMGYFGTNSSYEIEKRANEGDQKAQLIEEAMAYQIGKSIGEMGTVLKGEVDGILITGGVAHNKKLVEYVRSMVGFIAPVFVYPGEDEMSALATNAFMLLRGETQVKEYK